ncbi:MAG: SPOR domain-containing protein [Caldimonas sp.]
MFKQKSDPSAASARLEPADAVRLARVKARQRLIGAIVLLGIGIIGFPLVFETQPRPIPVDIPIEIPRRDALPPLAMPPPRVPAAASGRATSDAASAASAAPASAAPRAAARASEAVITESSSDAGREIPPPRPVASNPRVAATPPAAPPTAPTAPAATAPKISADGERAKALLEGRSAAATDETRFVVQVGAFADAEAARETRKRVEKLGFKTYTQVAQTPSGSRIRVRVGPFASRGEAESALAKAKAAGLSAVLLTL